MRKILSKNTYTLFLLFASIIANGQNYTLKDSVIVDSLIQVSMRTYYIDNQKAIPPALEAFRITKLINYENGYRQCYNALSVAYQGAGMVDSNEYYTQKGIEYHFNKKNRRDSIDGYFEKIRLANIYAKRGQIGEALKLCQVSMHYLDAAKDTQGMMAVRGTMGSIYLQCDDQDIAINYYLERLDLIRDLKFHQARIHTAASYSTLAKAYIAKENYSKALTYIDSSKAIFIEIDDQLDLNSAYLMYSETYLAMGDLDKALPNIKQALARSSQNKSMSQHAFALLYMCEYYRNINQLDSAKYYGEESYKLALQIQNYTLMEVLYLEMGTILSKLGEYKTSNEFLLKHIEIRDSLRKESLYRDVQADYFNEEITEYKLEKQQIENENKDKAATIKIWQIAGALLITVIGIVLFLIISLYRKRKKLNEAIYQLSKTNDVKNKLLAIISHDLRSPLSSLYSLIALTRRGVVSEEDKTRLYEKLEQNLNITLTLVDNLLYWSKNQINEIKPELESTDISKIIATNAELYNTTAAGKTIKIATSFCENNWVIADKGMMNIVVRNLVSNAIKFTPTGGTITIATKPVNNKLRVQVEDTGVGMNSKKIEYLFTENNTSELGTNNEKGTGLGLLLGSQFVKMNNSLLNVESTVEKGTLFYFDLPIAN